MSIDTKVETLSGVGEAKAKKLAKMGIITVGDLLNHFPKEHEDRTQIYTISTAPVGEKVSLSVTVTQPPRYSALSPYLDVVNVKTSDHVADLNLALFNQKFAMKSFHIGEQYMVYGTLQHNNYGYSISNPVFERLGQQTLTGRLVPRYHLTTGISNQMMYGMVLEALDKYGHLVEEHLPDYLAKDLPNLVFSYRNIHFPDNMDTLVMAKERLAFEEAFFLCLGLGLLKTRRDDNQSYVIPTIPVEEFPLPFTPTNAQARVMTEIAQNLASGQGMNRLVQGDVGSGKTAVSAYAGFLTIKAGFQVAMMVPTEVLAQQHVKSLTSFFAPLNMTVALLTSSMPTKEKRDVKKGLKDGTIDFVVGTQALLTKDVLFEHLALVVVDEQHRFGVEQRGKLTAKSSQHPHVLVMSATPIPRTLALMIYGDLEVSIIDELPPNRTPIDTFVVGEDKRQRMYGFVDKQVSEGRQVYIVCPAVEESDSDNPNQDLKAVTVFVEELQQKIFPHLRIAFVHGKRKPKEKEEVMSAFSQGAFDVLVSTTVIEVGVDVPNANLIIIENADRFGLSQLHQLRGRVGRGKHKSFCVLISATKNPDTLHRLNTLASTTDGFKISEEDLKIRGPGDFFGSRQHGLPSLKLADLSGDMRVMSQAQHCANAVIQEDPKLQDTKHIRLKRRVQHLFEESLDIFN